DDCSADADCRSISEFDAAPQADLIYDTFQYADKRIEQSYETTREVDQNFSFVVSLLPERRQNFRL
ncbi:MAG: hypothetical protein ACI9WC_001639, partial [Arenicella sp.]